MTDPDDPQDPRWCGLAWSEWHPLDGTAESGLVPPEAGLYRLRCRGRAELIYVGVSRSLQRWESIPAVTELASHLAEASRQAGSEG